MRMKGTFQQFESESVRVSWRLHKRMPKVKYTLGTVGDRRRVNRSDFLAGTTTGDRLIQTARVTTPGRWRSVCA